MHAWMRVAAIHTSRLKALWWKHDYTSMASDAYVTLLGPQFSNQDVENQLRCHFRVFCLQNNKKMDGADVEDENDPFHNF